MPMRAATRCHFCRHADAIDATIDKDVCIMRRYSAMLMLMMLLLSMLMLMARCRQRVIALRY